MYYYWIEKTPIYIHNTLIGSYENAQSLLVENISRFLSINKCTADNLFDRKDVSLYANCEWAV